MKSKMSLLECESLLDLLDQWAELKPANTVFTFLGREGEEKETLTFAQLRDKALSIAFALREKNAAGQRVVLFFQPGLEFICAFFGCLYAGAIAVPIPPPQGKRQIPRVNAILQDASPMMILSCQEIRQKLQNAGSDRGISSTYEWLDYEGIAESQQMTASEVLGSDIAFLQYTSGSTSLPKGVMVTHANILRNEQIIAEAFEHDQRTVVVGWLPFYHDMGLIGNILQPIFLGASCVLMSPLTFLTEPVQWLKAISKYSATTSGGPNFAYQLCAAKIPDEELHGLDLSSWKIAFNGSEHVHAQTIKAFSQKFSRFGFDSRAFYPCYGMAECTLFATGGHAGQEVNIAKYSTGDQDTREIEAVSCGFPRQGEEVRIVDPKTGEECADGAVGEIWLKGESIAQGYWNKPEATREIFQAFMSTGEGPYLRTGDLGFKKEVDLYIVGRLKNMIIIRGRNLFPHDIEQVVSGSHPALEGCLGAAFAVTKETEEKLVIVQEVDRVSYRKYDPSEIFRMIKKAVADNFQIDIHAILFVKTGSLPRTTSGKLQHYLCREMFLEGTLSPLDEVRENESKQQLDFSKIDLDHVSGSSPVLTFLAVLLNIPVEDILTDESLPAHGIDSMKALRFVHWVKKSYGVDIEVEWLFADTSINDIIAKISEGNTACRLKEHPPQIKQNIEGIPLSFNQENLWAIHCINPGDTSYNIPVILRVEGSFDCKAFEESLDEAVQRHAALRTSICAREGTPYQVVHEAVGLPISSIDLSCFSPDERMTRIDQHVKEEAFAPFQLDRAPLFRIKLLKLSGKELVLLLTFHHLIIDGWSFNVLVEDIRNSYRSKVLNEMRKADGEIASYASFSVMQRDLIGTASFEKAKQYWTQYLQDDAPIISISKLQASKPTKESTGAVRYFTIEGQLLELLSRFNKSHECTMAMTLLAAFHALVHHYSRENRVQIGYPSSNRSQTDFLGTLGFFVNTLVSKSCTREDTAFLDLLNQVKTGLLSGLKHDFFPFQEIVKAVNPPRIEGVSPLFQVMFVMQNAPSKVDGFPNVAVHISPNEHLSPIYNLVLEAAQQEDKLALTFEFKRECLPEFIVDQFIRHYVNFLKYALEHPQTKIARIPFLSASENQKLMLEWNDTFTVHGNAANVIDLFEERVRIAPDAPAVKSQGIAWTYHELNQQANRIAAHLLHMGLGQQDTVGFCLERSPMLIAVMLGIIKAGGIYVPIDHNLPVERKHFMLEDAGIRFLIIEPGFKSAFRDFSGTLIDVSETAQNVWTGQEVEEVHQPCDTAYILYTSGSTGKPKGVVVAHRSLLNFTQAAIRLFENSARDKVLQFASLSWDTCSEEIYPCLASGGTLVLRSNSPVEPFDELLDLTNREKLTVWDLPTTYWHDLTDYMISRRLKLPASLRLLIVGGEKVAYRKVRDWESCFGRSVRLLNTYGATEATSISSAYDLYHWTEGMDTPIGKPIDNVRMYVLNADLQPQPIGVAGDLYIGGEGVGMEYRNLPDLTAMKFIPDPFVNDPDAKLYKTGDIAYFGPSGDIYLLGRDDNQVKRRGYRIELEEIQRAIEEVPGIDRCLVLLKKINAQETGLNAYMMPKRTESPELLVEEVRKHLKLKLPDYMMPDEFLFLDEFPRLPNGKLDYKSFDLKAVKAKQKENIAVASELENEILDVWKEILGHSITDPHLSFFDVGGNSLSILKLHQKLNEKFQVTINISELFSHHTSGMQANLIEGIKKSDEPELSTFELLKLLEKGSVSIQEVKSQLNKR